MKINDLEAVKFGTSVYRDTYKARGWHFPQAVCEDLRAASIAAVQEVLATYAGRDRHKYPKNLRMDQAADAARNAMRRMADARKPSSMSLGSGAYHQAEPTGADLSTPLLQEGQQREVDREGNKDHGAVRQRGVSLAENPGQRRMSDLRAARELAYERLSADQKDLFDRADRIGNDVRFVSQQCHKDRSGYRAADLANALHEAREAYKANLTAALKDDAAIEQLQFAVQADWIPDTSVHSWPAQVWNFVRNKLAEIGIKPTPDMEPKIKQAARQSSTGFAAWRRSGGLANWRAANRRGEGYL